METQNSLCHTITTSIIPNKLHESSKLFNLRPALYILTQKTVTINACGRIRKALTEKSRKCDRSVRPALFWESAEQNVGMKMDDDNKTIQNFHDNWRRRNIPDPSVMLVRNRFQSLRRMCPTSPRIMEAGNVSETLQTQFILTCFTPRGNWIMGEIMVV
jgi:hypothetical protein